MSREVRLTIARINQLPPFTGTLDPNDLVAFFDVSTGITHKIKVSEIGAGAQGTTDHSQLTLESRALPGQHPIGAITGLQGELGSLFDSQQAEAAARIAKDDSLQEQILTMQENNPVAQIRYLTSDPIVLNTETFYQSKADKGTAPAFEITTLITATTPETANIVAQWVGVALTQPLELIDQITSLLIKARKDRTGREITLFAEFYDYTDVGVKTLKGTSSQVILTDTTTAYDLYFPIQAYLAAAGSRGLIVVKGFQTGAGAAASIILSIEGDYYSRWSYTLPAGALSFLDEKLISSQDLPAIGSLAGETQKDVNVKMSGEIGELNYSQLTFSDPVLTFNANKIYQAFQVTGTFEISKTGADKQGAIIELCLIADGVIGHKPTFASSFSLQFDNWNNTNGARNLVRMKLINDKVLTEIRTL